MVTVDKLKILGFGRFIEREFSLTPGLNVIYGGNEAGKSTIHRFIEAMLFGFWHPIYSHRELEPSHGKYRPWAGAVYGGEMEYSWRQGKVRVIRDFSQNTVSLYSLPEETALTDLPLNSWGEPDFARIHFGCSKLIFRNTISISQLGSATDSAVAAEVRGLLNNLAQSGGSGVSVSQGLEELANSRRKLASDLKEAELQLVQIRERLIAAKEQTHTAANLEIRQFKMSKQLEKHDQERRRLKELSLKAQGQAAVSKLKLLNELRERHSVASQQLQELGQIAVDPEMHQELLDAQAKVEMLQQTCDLHAQTVEDLVKQRLSQDNCLQELAPYAHHSQDTLIEMSSAWQMQAKGHQVIEEMEEEVEKLGQDIRQVAADLAKLPYFRPDALDQAKALQAMAAARDVNDSREELDREIEQQLRVVKSCRGASWVLLLALPALAALAFWLEPLLVLLGIPALIALIAVARSAKQASLRCRSLRRQMYSLELEFVNNQRTREHAQRELSGYLGRLGIAHLQEMEDKFYSFKALTDRKYELAREQRFTSAKLEEYYQETEAKATELQEILQSVGLGDLPIEQALAHFRSNLDRIVELRTLLEQGRIQEETASKRLIQCEEDLAAAQEELSQRMGIIGAKSPEEVETMVAKTKQRREWDQEIAGLEHRIHDLLTGTTEAELRIQAQEASGDSEESIQDIPNKIELLEEEILLLRTQKSEEFGRLEGIYSSLASPADLEEECWEQQEKCVVLQDNLQAVDIAYKTITELAAALKSEIAPDLNEKVSLLVEQVTGGKYNSLKVAPDMSISVFSPEGGGQVGLEKLSGGTIDQFYFACRVAIADLVTGGGLPLFLDDSFVQYDDQRLEYMLSLLLALAETRQIILLTCQQRELEQLASIGAGRYRPIYLDS